MHGTVLADTGLNSDTGLRTGHYWWWRAASDDRIRFTYRESSSAPDTSQSVSRRHLAVHDPAARSDDG